MSGQEETDLEYSEDSSVDSMRECPNNNPYSYDPRANIYSQNYEGRHGEYEDHGKFMDDRWDPEALRYGSEIDELI